MVVSNRVGAHLAAQTGWVAGYLGSDLLACSLAGWLACSLACWRIGGLAGVAGW